MRSQSTRSMKWRWKMRGTRIMAMAVVMVGKISAPGDSKTKEANPKRFRLKLRTKVRNNTTLKRVQRKLRVRRVKKVRPTKVRRELRRRRVREAGPKKP